LIVEAHLPIPSVYYTTRHPGNVNRVAAPVSALSAVQDTLDLSAPARDLLGSLQGLEESERSEYLEILARLLAEGIVGTEALVVDERSYSSFASTRAADPDLKDARRAAFRSGRG
jgi:hypothetical protein